MSFRRRVQRNQAKLHRKAQPKPRERRALHDFDTVPPEGFAGNRHTRRQLPKVLRSGRASRRKG